METQRVSNLKSARKLFSVRPAPVATLGRGNPAPLGQRFANCLRLALRAALAGSVRFADAIGRQAPCREKSPARGVHAAAYDLRSGRSAPDTPGELVQKPSPATEGSGSGEGGFDEKCLHCFVKDGRGRSSGRKHENRRYRRGTDLFRSGLAAGPPDARRFAWAYGPPEGEGFWSRQPLFLIPNP